MIVNARFLTQNLTGVQRHAIEISLVLKKLQPDIRFIAPKNIIHDKIAEILGAEIIGHFTGYIWEQYELPRFMKNQGHGGLLINLANMAPINYKNKIVTIHDTAPLRHPEWYSWKFATVYKWLLPRVAKSSRIIFSVSAFSKNEIADVLEIDRAKIEVIHGAANQRFSRLKSNETDIPTQDYILCVASIDPRKNFTRLLEAFSLLDRRNLKLIIVGSKSKVFAESTLDKTESLSDQIEFTGHISDERLIELYRHAGLFVYPSLYEGFGLPPLEAMACGCPCVVSDSGSLPEICGEAAVYCDPYDSNDIAAKINQVLSDKNLRQRLIENGHTQARKFNWEKSAQRLLETIKKLS